MKQIGITTLLLIGCLFVFGQDSITLDLCYQKAIENYPLTRQKDILPEANELKIKNLNKNFLPEMMVNGQMHYQSDVTKTPFQDVTLPGLPAIPEVSKDWYKITLDINQAIYDGSATGRQKEVENINLQIDQQKVDIELYKLKERINQIYFNVLLLHENKKVLLIHQETLSSQLSNLESGFRNGTILSSNVDILKVEIINLEQSIAEIEISIQSTLSILNEFTGLDLDENTQFALPEVFIDLNAFNNKRLEYSLFSLQQNKINASKHLIGSKLLPKFSAFGQAGYGRPGYDMLKDEFDDFYMIGARVHWNIWDWSHSKKEKEILDLHSDLINTQKETFDKNVRIDLQSKVAAIRKIEEMIKRDGQIIELREKITGSASSQLENGQINSTEYLHEVNAEARSKLDMEAHKIKLIKAKLDYAATLGNL